MDLDIATMRPEVMEKLISEQIFNIVTKCPELEQERGPMRREVAKLRVLYELTVQKIEMVAEATADETIIWLGHLARTRLLYNMAQIELCVWEACQHGRPIDMKKFATALLPPPPFKETYAYAKGLHE